MRLLNTFTLEIREFIVQNTPPYAILSHTWGVGEITFEDLIKEDKTQARQKNGFLKLNGFCEKAKEVGFEWVWMDTCCIDKKSSAELGEAINSMFAWYQKANVCYAYLDDFKYPPNCTEPDYMDSPNAYVDSLKKCRWFTRGWTLQELLAPGSIEMYAPDWSEIGTKATLASQISSITGIQLNIIRGYGVELNVAQKLSWAAGRSTTKIEDIAYCLLGIFNINMPLLYGEGTKAFRRLQEEILRTTDDYTLFIWNILDFRTNRRSSSGPFADSPDAFGYNSTGQESLSYADVSSTDIQFPEVVETLSTMPPKMTNRGLKIRLPVLKVPDFAYYNGGLLVHFPLSATKELTTAVWIHRQRVYGDRVFDMIFHLEKVLLEKDEDEIEEHVDIDLVPPHTGHHICLWLESDGDQWCRLRGLDIVFIRDEDLAKFEYQTVYIQEREEAITCYVRRLGRVSSFIIQDANGALQPQFQKSWIEHPDDDGWGGVIHSARFRTTNNDLFFAHFSISWCELVVIADISSAHPWLLAEPVDWYKVHYLARQMSKSAYFGPVVLDRAVARLQSGIMVRLCVRRTVAAGATVTLTLT
ncbi:HET-domain-containing protein [Pseudovirgaria hyperparasitica]|uniref:HET-domain-containing protein n=1 Tax=Pseudovirgaria hyperparasitica TaxID=470096 RepID=A0A6A6WAQ4_9PEZI|nr:HET-domain-containing protein [Pseudovirgaria hyperparasitica]KAF2759753.1 HET-domain-containing protein [Pseudovirgaria hyperparasitica]